MTVSQEQSVKNATLLIVDDDARTRRSLSQFFEEAGHAVVPVEDAPAALRKLHQERCDLIVLDIELPGVNGLALCRILRAQEGTKRLPIVVLSSHSDEKYKIEAFAAGADDFVVKPYTPRELLLRVNSHLEAALRERALEGSNRELGFVADLGRGLLHALEPLQVVRRVAGTTFEGANTALCAAVVETDADGAGLAACVFDREGVAEENTSHINNERLMAWLASVPTASVRIKDRNQFLLKDKKHVVEYVAPLRFEGRIMGALIAAFDRREDCGETESRLIDAAAQQGSLAARISALYAAERASSARLAEEVKRRTAEAVAQRLFTENIIDSLPVSLYAIDRDYRVVAWNRNRELGGQGIPRGEVLGRNIFDVLTKQKREVLEREFARAFETGQIERIEQETVTPDGITKHWLVSKIPMRDEKGIVTHIITVGEDITERVEAGRAVARTEKLAAVGRLAAGVVHEINNPLATISACAEALQSRVAEGLYGSSSSVDDLRDYLQLIHSEAFRCKSITNGLLDFSRARAGQHAPVSIANVVNSSARLLLHQRRNVAVKIDVDVADDLPEVLGDEGQLQQAVIVLAENAIDAMPEGGTLTLRAHAGDSGLNVLIDVADTGVGIPQENLAKIFDPFFTTKEIGRGTGLGLAVCYGIVTEHGGRISVDSTVGHGTTFTLTLPAINSRNGDKQLESADSTASENHRR